MRIGWESFFFSDSQDEKGHESLWDCDGSAVEKNPLPSVFPLVVDHLKSLLYLTAIL